MKEINVTGQKRTDLGKKAFSPVVEILFRSGD